MRWLDRTLTVADILVPVMCLIFLLGLVAWLIF